MTVPQPLRSLSCWTITCNGIGKADEQTLAGLIGRNDSRSLRLQVQRRQHLVLRLSPKLSYMIRAGKRRRIVVIL
jgi:hypothetical protein